MDYGGPNDAESNAYLLGLQNGIQSRKENHYSSLAGKRNARDEVLRLINQAKSEIKCGFISSGIASGAELKCGHSEDDFNRFINALNFNYGDGCGSRSGISGVIWLINGNWIDGDGGSKLSLRSPPTIPDRLMGGCDD